MSSGEVTSNDNQVLHQLLSKTYKIIESPDFDSD